MEGKDMAKEVLTEERYKMIITTMKNHAAAGTIITTRMHAAADTITITKMHAAVDTSIIMRSTKRQIILLIMQRSRCIFWKTWDVHIARLRWKKRFRHCLR